MRGTVGGRVLQCIAGVEVAEETAPGIVWRMRYTGRFFDIVAQLQDNLRRKYDAAIARWASTDPIGFQAGDANLYRYVNNGPLWQVDPLGLRGITEKEANAIIDLITKKRAAYPGKEGHIWFLLNSRSAEKMVVGLGVHTIFLGAGAAKGMLTQIGLGFAQDIMEDLLNDDDLYEDEDKLRDRVIDSLGKVAKKQSGNLSGIVDVTVELLKKAAKDARAEEMSSSITVSRSWKNGNESTGEYHIATGTFVVSAKMKKIPGFLWGTREAVDKWAVEGVLSHSFCDKPGGAKLSCIKGDGDDYTISMSSRGRYNHETKEYEIGY